MLRYKHTLLTTAAQGGQAGVSWPVQIRCRAAKRGPHRVVLGGGGHVQFVAHAAGQELVRWTVCLPCYATQIPEGSRGRLRQRNRAAVTAVVGCLMHIVGRRPQLPPVLQQVHQVAPLSRVAVHQHRLRVMMACRHQVGRLLGQHLVLRLA